MSPHGLPLPLHTAPPNASPCLRRSQRDPPPPAREPQPHPPQPKTRTPIAKLLSLLPTTSVPRPPPCQPANVYHALGRRQPLVRPSALLSCLPPSPLPPSHRGEIATRPTPPCLRLRLHHPSASRARQPARSTTATMSPSRRLAVNIILRPRRAPLRSRPALCMLPRDRLQRRSRCSRRLQHAPEPPPI